MTEVDAKKVVFLTGTRADFGKLKSLIRSVESAPQFESHIFVTGMHSLSRYGYTVDEIQKGGFKNIHLYINQVHGEPMDQVLANTVSGLSRYVQEIQPDFLVIHGDRPEALAGAIVGSFNNILVGHIEGGELSGTLDELIRHSISKLSHVHFVANKEAGDRLKQMGELPSSIYTIGSPDIDLMLSPNLPSDTDVKKRYGFSFERYGVVLFHPVVSELSDIRRQADALVDALLESDENYVVVYSNNDTGCNHIFDAYERLEGHARFRLYPSIRFEYFLSLLKYASFIIGNSSAGVREAPVFGLPTINIGSRQQNRFEHESIMSIECQKEKLIESIVKMKDMSRFESCLHFGRGNSAESFMEIISGSDIWKTATQKQFLDIRARDVSAGPELVDSKSV